MTPAEGKRKVQRLLGSKVFWRDSGEVTSPETRAAAKARHAAAKERYVKARDAEQKRLKELLNGDPLYLSLRAEYAAAHKEQNEAQSEVLSRAYRLDVGINLGWATETKAHGDNWADVVRNLEAKMAKA